MSGFFAAGTWWDVSREDNDHIKGAAEKLAAAGIEGAVLEAQRLWAASAPRQYTDANALYDGTTISRFDALVDRRVAREPLSHLLGYRDFYKHRFVVSSDVLDPRPDTEDLVVAALDVPFRKVLDLGTGSGCILLSLLADRPNAVGVGTDLSEAALAVATQNVARLELETRATLLASNWFENVDGQFDLIVSNPPYIATDEMANLQPEVREHEPRMALTDESDGLSCYRIISEGASAHLTPGGHLMVEIGPTQASAVSEMMQMNGFASVTLKTDIDGRDRVVIGQKPVE